jgi:prevent-host-death family protein
MKKASVSEAKNSLSALLDKVKAGASIVIQDRGRPVARLEPISSAGSAGDRLEQLIRDGVVRPARGPIPRKLLTSEPPAARGSVSALEALLEERRKGR